MNLVSFHAGESPGREAVPPADRLGLAGEVVGEAEGDPLGQDHGRAGQAGTAASRATCSTLNFLRG